MITIKKVEKNSGIGTGVFSECGRKSKQFHIVF